MLFKLFLNLFVGLFSITFVMAHECVKDTVNLYESLSEENLFFNFYTRTAGNWTGLDGWKFVPNNKGMILKGAPDTGDNHDYLVLASERGNFANLTSPLLPAFEGDFSYPFHSCLHFKYHIRVQNHKDYGLTVSWISVEGNRRQLWSMSRQDYDIWESVEIVINRIFPTRIQFTAGQNSDGIIALKDFELRDGQCKRPNYLDDNIESDNQVSLEDFFLLNGVKRGVPEEIDMKREDHTSDSLFGRSVIITSYKKEYLKHMVIYRSQLPLHKCFRFAFMSNIQGTYVLVFQISKPDSRNMLWTSFDKNISYAPNEWHLIQVQDNFLDTRKYEIQFFKYWRSDESDNIHAVRIDDVKLLPHCLPDFSNDFRYGFGEWRSPKSSEHRWKIGKGRVVNRNDLNNIFQHPIAAYTDFTTTSNGSIMRLISGRTTQLNVIRCAQFDYIVKNSTSSTIFFLKMIDDNGGERVLWSYDSNSYVPDFHYKIQQVVIPAVNVPYRLEFYVSTDNPYMSAAVMKIEVINASLEQCSSTFFQTLFRVLF